MDRKQVQRHANQIVKHTAKYLGKALDTKKGKKA